MQGSFCYLQTKLKKYIMKSLTRVCRRLCENPLYFSEIEFYVKATNMFKENAYTVVYKIFRRYSHCHNYLQACYHVKNSNELLV